MNEIREHVARKCNREHAFLLFLRKEMLKPFSSSTCLPWPPSGVLPPLQSETHTHSSLLLLLPSSSSTPMPAAKAIMMEGRYVCLPV